MTMSNENNVILNASDIEVHFNNQKIAHITDARFSSSHEPRTILSNDTAPDEIKLPGKITWQVTGNSLIEMSDGYSFKDLLILHRNRSTLDLKFKLSSDTEVTGKANLSNIDGGGPTEENATVSFTFSGSGLYEIPYADVDEDVDEDV